MKFEHRRDIGDEVQRVYDLPDGPYVVEHPVAVYTSPGLDYEGVMDQYGEIHLLPRPGVYPVRILRTPTSGEPLA